MPDGTGCGLLLYRSSEDVLCSYMHIAALAQKQQFHLRLIGLFFLHMLKFGASKAPIARNLCAYAHINACFSVAGKLRIVVILQRVCDAIKSLLIIGAKAVNIAVANQKVSQTKFKG